MFTLTDTIFVPPFVVSDDGHCTAITDAAANRLYIRTPSLSRTDRLDYVRAMLEGQLDVSWEIAGS